MDDRSPHPRGTTSRLAQLAGEHGRAVVATVSTLMVAAHVAAGATPGVGIWGAAALLSPFALTALAATVAGGRRGWGPWRTGVALAGVWAGVTFAVSLATPTCGTLLDPQRCPAGEAALLAVATGLLVPTGLVLVRPGMWIGRLLARLARRLWAHAASRSDDR